MTPDDESTLRDVNEAIAKATSTDSRIAYLIEYLAEPEADSRSIRKELCRRLHEEVGRRTSDETESGTTARKTKLCEQIAAVRNYTIDAKARREMFAAGLFLALLAVAVGVTALVAYFPPKLPVETSITIEYNVGEIIAGVLAGIGAAAAGLGYASSKLAARE